MALLLGGGGAAAGAVGGSAAAAGDADRGRQLYARCAACHSLTVDRTGPRHCGLLGRRAGAVPGFAYSDAMRKSGIVWSAVTLDRFLADPMEAVPGTAMGYAGIGDTRERADLIAFLARASSSTACGS
jgi:cytochrome c